MKTYHYESDATPNCRRPIFYDGQEADHFRARFLDWAEPRGLEIPATAADLESWVGRYTAETGDEQGSDSYLMRECY